MPAPISIGVEHWSRVRNPRIAPNCEQSLNARASSAMLEQVPIRVWILIAIAAFAFAPARYVWQYILHSPAQRDITQPPTDLSWRKPRQFGRDLAILAALFALAIFIFTPTAEEFARSPRFFPILIGSFGAWALFTVAQGLIGGRIEPFAKGTWETYQRQTQPIRFWLSIAWNSVLGISLISLAVLANNDASIEMAGSSCSYETDAPLEDKLSACNNLIRSRPDEPEAYFQRGLITFNSGDLDRAIRDFTKANKLDPKDPWPLANRGIAFAWKKDPERARADFEAVRRIDPANPVMLRGTALLRKDAGDIEGAVESLTASLESDPDDLWALRTRAELYWELGEVEKSREDDRRWLQLKEKARTRAERASST